MDRILTNNRYEKTTNKINMGAFAEPLPKPNMNKADYQENAYLTDKNICFRCGNKLQEVNERLVCDSCVNVYKIEINE